jgi:hypothetical protein
MKGEANIWFTDLERFGMIGSWESFVGKIEVPLPKGNATREGNARRRGSKPKSAATDFTKEAN